MRQRLRREEQAARVAVVMDIRGLRIARARGHRAGAWLLAVLLPALLLLAVPGRPALAGAILEVADPADGSVLDVAPTTIILRFSESLDPVGSTIDLKAVGGGVLDTGFVVPSADRKLRIDVSSILPNGDYKVRWTALSLVDGTKIGRAHV